MSRVPQLRRPYNSLARPGKKSHLRSSRERARGRITWPPHALSPFQPHVSDDDRPRRIGRRISLLAGRLAQRLARLASRLSFMIVRASTSQSLVGNRAAVLFPACQTIETQTNHLRICALHIGQLGALGRFPSDPLKARFQAGRRGSARCLHFWGSGRCCRDRCLWRLEISHLPRMVYCVSECSP